MSLLLVCILTLSVFWKGGCQRGDGQIPQFNFTAIDVTTVNSRLPDSSGSFVLRNPTENSLTSAPLSINKVSHEDSGTSTPQTITTPTPSRTPSLERVTPPTTVTNIGASLTSAESDTDAMLTTEATNTTAVLSIAVTIKSATLATATTNTSRMLTTAETNTNAALTTAAADTKVTPTTAATGLTAALTTVATNMDPAVTLAVNKTNALEENRETKAPSASGDTPATQTPSITSAETDPEVHVIDRADDDYYDEEEEEEAKKKKRGDMPKCAHDPCAHLQRPCLEVSQGSCMCPGLSPDSIAPAPPVALEVRDVTASSAEVRWCAPYSSVSGYELRVREETSGALTSHALDTSFRRFLVTDLREGRAYSVCVTAKNLAGSSSAVCARLVTSKAGALVIYALAAAVVALGLALGLVLAVCLCRGCRKPPLQTQRNTSLISIPNPAYCHPQETANVLKV